MPPELVDRVKLDQRLGWSSWDGWGGSSGILGAVWTWLDRVSWIMGWRSFVGWRWWGVSPPLNGVLHISYCIEDILVHLVLVHGPVNLVASHLRERGWPSRLPSVGWVWLGHSSPRKYLDVLMREGVHIRFYLWLSDVFVLGQTPLGTRAVWKVG